MPVFESGEGSVLPLHAFIPRFHREIACVLGMVSLGVVIPATLAAGYPDRPVRFIVPTTAGGGSDTTTRVVAAKLAEYLGQPTVVDNRPGVSGNLGAERLAGGIRCAHTGRDHEVGQGRQGRRHSAGVMR